APPAPAVPLSLPPGLEDSLTVLISRGQSLLARETMAASTGPLHDHPEAWNDLSESLVRLLQATGDSALEHSRAINFLIDRGVHVTMATTGLDTLVPLLVSFINPGRTTEAAGEQWLKWSALYEVRADSLKFVRRRLDPSYYGPGAWAMEALARGHREWAAPFVDSREVLDRLAALPWAKARSGWKLVSYSAHFDTLTCAHPVMGRLTLYA